MRPIPAPGISTACVAIILVPFLAACVAADTASSTGATLPSGREQTSAVWDGLNAYIFGGLDGLNGHDLDQIVRYSPSSNTATLMTAALPFTAQATSAVWDGTRADVFGGSNPSGDVDRIVRYDPATDTASLAASLLPSPRHGTSAVWDGTDAYIFGGNDASGWLTQIVKYSPATDTLTVLAATLPTGRAYTSAIWDGTNAYIFGGSAVGEQILDEIVRFNPATDTVTTMGARLPSVRLATSAVWSGSAAFVFGGNGAGSGQDIVRYDPSTDTVERLPTLLPSSCFAASAVWDGSSAYIFGGTNGPSELGQVVQFRSSVLPGAPQGLAAAPGLRSITLSWNPPASAGDGTIMSYRVYRGTASGAELPLISGGCSGLGNVLACTDTGLGDRATFYYRVSALTQSGEGPQSDEATATTIVRPTAPQALAAQAGPGLGQVTVSWMAPIDNGGAPLTGYTVYGNTGSGWSRVATLPGTRLSWTQSNLSPLGTYSYAVTASNPLDGPASNLACANPYPVGAVLAC